MKFYHGTTNAFNINKVILPPIVYEVKPIGQYFNTIYGEYISEKALVLGKVD